MKNLLKRSTTFVLALGFVFSSVSTFAVDPTDNPEKLKSVAYSIKNSQKVAVGVKLQETAKVTLKILDSQGKIIFKESINKTEGFLRTYDLTENGNGEYTFQISSGKEVQTKHVTVDSKEDQKPFKAYFVSKLRDKKIKVSYYNAHSPATVSILDLNGELVSKDVISSKINNGAVINLRNLPKGSYQLVVNSGDKGISKDITIQ